MCCRLTVSPSDPDIARTVLAVGMFTASHDANRWTRFIAEESTTVVAIIGEKDLRLELMPAVSFYAQHAGKRIAAGVYFEIAAKYAEKVGGKITQHSNVSGCTDGGINSHVLAQYPDMPILWEQVCPGFRETLLGT